MTPEQLTVYDEPQPAPHNTLAELPPAARYTAAIEALQQKLEELYDCAKTDTHCQVYAWYAPNEGIRIAEISFSRKTESGVAGCSSMRSMPESASFILASEEYLRTYGKQPYRPPGWDSDIDDHADAVWLLQEVIAQDRKPEAPDTDSEKDNDTRPG
jgi:hypothetical protein